MARVACTPNRIEKTGRYHYVLKGYLTPSRMDFEHYFDDGFVGVPDRHVGVLEPEYKLWKAGYAISGTLLQDPKISDYSNLPQSKFNLSIFKGGQHIMSTEYSQGFAHRYDPQTRGQLKMFFGRPTYGQRLACERSIPATPTLAGVLYCLQADASCVDGYTFNDFCSSFGYDNDSMKAHKIYLACQETLDALRLHLSELQKILRDF